MPAIAIIPARYASTRFPAKPLARETGKFLIQHVYEQVSKAQRIATVVVATDDERIAEAVRSFGGRVEMTRDDHVSGTDRIAEVVRRWGAGDVSIPGDGAGGTSPPGGDGSGRGRTTAQEQWHPAGKAGQKGNDRVAATQSQTNSTDSAAADIILNVQGDEPEIEPDVLDQLVSRMESDPTCRMGTLACLFPAGGDPRDPNTVKVVCDCRGRALYFSRSLIPYPRDDVSTSDRGGWLLHIGVYAFRRDYLLDFAGRPASALEKTERLEQLRALEAGDPIAVEIVQRSSPGVDTPADYAAFVGRWRSRS